MQIYIQGSSNGVVVGNPIPLEVSNWKVAKKAKLKTYSRVQASSDTSLNLGVYNPVYTFTTVVPQDFTNAEDVESLMFHLRAPDQAITDIEENQHSLRITNTSVTHQGGIPNIYTIDIEAIESFASLPPIALPFDEVWPIAGTKNDSSTWFGMQRKSFYANGRWWLFYYDGDGFEYVTSTNRSTWTSLTQILLDNTQVGYNVSVWFDGTYMYYTVGNLTIGHSVRWRQGTPNTDGTITWTAAEQTISIPNLDYPQYPQPIVDASNGEWLDTGGQGGTPSGGYTDKNAHSDGTWLTGTPSNFNPDNANFSGKSVLVPLLGSRVGIVYHWNDTFPDCRLAVQTWNGASWSIPIPASLTTNYCYTLDAEFSAVSIGNIIHVAFLTNTPWKIVYARFDTTLNEFVEEKVLVTTNDSEANPAIAQDKSGYIYIFYPDNTNKVIKYLKRSPTGAWSSVRIATSASMGNFPPSPPASTHTGITATWNDTGGYIMVNWVTQKAHGGYGSSIWAGFLATH
jgi:hypothetical protein